MKDIVTFPALGKNGRLGNQLFQIAATLGVTADNDLMAVFPEWEYNKYLATPIPVGLCPYNPTHFYQEPSFNYTKIDLSVSLKTSLVFEQHVYALEGYFQSKKYFEKYESEIIKRFTPSKEVLNKIFDKYKGNIANTCAIHVRRGDYVNNPFYHQLDLDYYITAMDYIRKETSVHRFVIFSDDIAWCKRNFTGQKFIFTEGNTDFEDLIYMSLCDHQIIANSSFSWWGAFLNRNTEKRIVYPEKWFGEVAKLDHSDLLYF